jgi:hypothetical protein
MRERFSFWCALMFALTAFPASAAPPCWPAQLGGTGTVAVRASDAYGQAWGWWCQAPGGAIRVAITGAHEYLIKWPAANTNTKAWFAALWDLNVTGEPKPEAQPLRDSLHSKLAPTKPAQQAYVVAPISTGSRPTYTVVSGALKSDGLRISVLQPDGKPAPCDCAAGNFSASTSTYCQARATPPGLTLCKPVSP